MPLKNSFKPNYKARVISTHRFSPILALTTKPAANARLRDKEAGATGLTVTSFTPDRFVTLVEQVLAPKKG